MRQCRWSRVSAPEMWRRRTCIVRTNDPDGVPPARRSRHMPTIRWLGPQQALAPYKHQLEIAPAPERQQEELPHKSNDHTRASGARAKMLLERRIAHRGSRDQTSHRLWTMQQRHSLCGQSVYAKSAPTNKRTPACQLQAGVLTSTSGDYSTTVTDSKASPYPKSISASRPDSTFPKAVLRPFWRAL